MDPDPTLLTLQEQLAMSSSASSSEESDSNLSSDTFSGGNTGRERNMAEVIQHVIKKSNDLTMGKKNQSKSVVAPGVKMRHFPTKSPYNSSHFVPSGKVKSQSTASPIINSNKWIPVPPALPLPSSIVPIVEYSHSLEALAAENSDVAINTQLIHHILEEPSMPTPTPSPALSNDTPTNLIIDEGGESPASNTEPVPVTEMSSCSIIEGSQPSKPEVKLVGVEIAPPQETATVSAQETATVSAQETDVGPQSEASVKLKNRPTLPIDEVSKEARRYAIKWGFNVEKTINHWIKQNVESTEFVRNTGNKKGKSLMENPRINELFVWHPVGSPANPVRVVDFEGGHQQTPQSTNQQRRAPNTGRSSNIDDGQAQTPQTTNQQRRAPIAGRSSNIDDGRDEDSMADSDAAAEEEINLNIPLSEERPTVAMRLINAAALEQDRRLAETDKRAKRSNARNSLPDNDPERIADRAANFFWRLANAYINGRTTMMDRLNSIVDNLIADDRNPRLQERTFTNLYFRGIFHWMLIYFPVQDSRDTRLYIRRIKFKLKNNINSDRSRQRKKGQNEPRRDEGGAGAE